MTGAPFLYERLAETLVAAIAACVSLVWCASVGAQDTSRGVVRLVVGNPPGSGTDRLARRIAPKLAGYLNANVIVDNRLGANGSIATEYVAKSKPDGTTLKVNTLSEVLSVALSRPRHRLELVADPTYLAAREAVLQFLYERHRFVEAA